MGSDPGDHELREALAERTRALCDLASPFGQEAALCDLLARECDAMFPGEVQRVGHSLVLGRVPAESKRPLVALFGHLDTVPLQPGDFPARREGGRVYGRGASDMKGAVALLLELFSRLGPGGRAALAVDVLVVLYEREEGPFDDSGMPAVLAARPELSKAALALCLEPTDLALQLGCCGSMHATLTFTGRTAHSARPWQGDNAVHKAGALLTHLQSLAPREVVFESGPLRLVYREVMSITKIEGTSGRNVVPGACALNLNYRFAPGRSLDSAAQEVEALAARFGATCVITDRAPAGRVVLESPLVQSLAHLLGTAPEPKQAWTDVGRLGELGIPAANFGPGEQAQAHQKGESCPEDLLVRAYRLLERFLREGAR
ncbi:MAG: succinyl-diaminopimelate desuccinylase [Deltaproteobacteria bacterium]|nr:succinyl-diaminopimelate desuccinylase [Deltaproteobacteria bacterium]